MSLFFQNKTSTKMNADPNPYYSSLISNCIKTQNLKLGKNLHSHFIKTALILNAFLSNRLVFMYSKFNYFNFAQKTFDDLPNKNTHSWNIIVSAYCQMGRFDIARKLLDEMPEPKFVSYNALISSLGHYGYYKESLGIFKRMQIEYNKVAMDEFNLVSTMRSCGCLNVLKLLRQIHGVAVVFSLKNNIAVYNAMIDAYGKCGDIDTAFSVFERMVERDAVTWTTMVVAYSRVGRLEEAYRVFDKMPIRNTISWTSLITGFAQNGCAEEALDLFKRMLEENGQPNGFTFVGVLSACADLAVLDRGKQLHGHITRTSCPEDKNNVYLSNALIDMYSKCGDMKSAKISFEYVPEKDIVSWNSIITGFSQNGYGNESLAVFEKMIMTGMKPNHVTFISVLSACNHAGLEYEGLNILDLIKKNYSLCLRTDHYAIVIDLLGRKNKLKEAMELVKNAPSEINRVEIWGSLLGACRVHGDLDLACKASDALLELDPRNGARLVMISNVYADAGKWDDVRRVRELMVKKGLSKDTACSSIEIRNVCYNFIAKDKSCYDLEQDVCDLLDKLTDHMKDASLSSASQNI